MEKEIDILSRQTPHLSLFPSHPPKLFQAAVPQGTRPETGFKEPFR
jgi:hypothetical protein